jgi:hypothetical protein
MNASHRKGWLSLGLAVLVIAIVWSVVLPWLGTQPAVRARIELLDRRGIDPAALFYTDLPAMRRIEADLAAKREEHPEAFWGVGHTAED